MDGRRRRQGATDGSAGRLAACASWHRSRDDRWRSFHLVLRRGQAQVVEDAPVRHITVTLNKSKTLKFKSPFASAVIGSLEIADLLPMTDHTLYVQGKKVGTTNHFGVRRRQAPARGRRPRGDARRRLDKQPDRCEHRLRGHPRHQRERRSVAERRGERRSSASRAVDVAKAVLRQRIRRGDVINAMRVAPNQQVMLKVRFLEVDRTAGRDLGVNFFRREQERARRFRARRGFKFGDCCRCHGHR